MKGREGWAEAMSWNRRKKEGNKQGRKNGGEERLRARGKIVKRRKHGVM